MTVNEYQELALRTESPASKITAYDRLLHSAMGISTESGELMDVCKKYEQLSIT